MVYHNENDPDGIQEVLKHLHQYVPSCGKGEQKVHDSQGFVADQLSLNCLLQL